MKAHSLSLILVLVFLACSKQETSTTITPTPTPITVTECRIIGSRQAGASFTYTFNKDGYLESSNGSSLGGNNSTTFKYENGLLVGIVSEPIVEKYEYNNGVLKKITVVETNEKKYFNYQIDIETDANKRIIKMTDSFGMSNEIKRDSKGNITEIKVLNMKDNTEKYKLVITEYDSQKSRLLLYKGWQFDVEQYYADYMNAEKSLHNIFGGSNNPIKIQKFIDNKLSAEWTYSYEYNNVGYPTFINNNGDKTPFALRYFSYNDCK